MADAAKPIACPDSTQARHAEIARRYAWQALQRHKREDDKPDHSRLITLIRLRELERLFRHRYGRFLPDDDAGMDDLLIVAHHIAFLRGEIVAHIVAWSRAWAPWLPPHDAERLAHRVCAGPRKWSADALAWLLRLSMAERTALKIKTIGAFDVSKADREAIQKERKRDRERARRARKSTGRPRGRPRKNACHAGRENIARHGFSPMIGDAARELPETGPALSAFEQEKQIGTHGADGSQFLGLGKAATADVHSPTSRAAPMQTKEIEKCARQSRAPRDSAGLLGGHVAGSCEPPPEIIDKAADLASNHRNSGFWTMIVRREAEQMIRRFWPGYATGQIATARRYYGRFDPKRDLRNWDLAFRSILDREYEERHLHLERRSNWLRERKRRQDLRERHDRQARYCSTTKDDVGRAHRERQEHSDCVGALRARLAEEARQRRRAVAELYQP